MFNSLHEHSKADLKFSATMAKSTTDFELQRYLQLINGIQTHENSDAQGDACREEIRMAPLFSWNAKQLTLSQHKFEYSQYALLGQILPARGDVIDFNPVLINTDIPWSAFICGQQGSGKSYTLSCMLEGCLLDSPKVEKLPQPLTSIVFNYDSQAGHVCEAAYLCSAKIKVTVLVFPSTYEAMKNLYSWIPGAKDYLTVEPLYLKPKHLSTERMKRLMACGNNDTSPPLYMQVIHHPNLSDRHWAHQLE